MTSIDLKSRSRTDCPIMFSGWLTTLLLSLYEVLAMNDEKDKRPDPKVLNAVIVANNLAKGVYRKSKEEQDKSADNCENGTKK